MTVTRFTEYKFQRTKNLPCPDCGKKVRRSTTFTGTSNPFTNPPYMSYAQMGETLAPEMKAWKDAAVQCKKCLDAQQDRLAQSAPAEAADWNAANPIGTQVSFPYGGSTTYGHTTTEAKAANGDAYVGIEVPGKGDSWGRSIRVLTVFPDQAVRAVNR